MFSYTIIGPFLIDGSLLMNQTVTRIREMTGDNFVETWCQQGGIPPHCGSDVRAFLASIPWKMESKNRSD